MRALLLLQASREARRHITGTLSKPSSVAAAVGTQARSFAAAPVKADAATPKQREVRRTREERRREQNERRANNRRTSSLFQPWKF